MRGTPYLIPYHVHVCCINLGDIYQWRRQVDHGVNMHPFSLLTKHYKTGNFSPCTWRIAEGHFETWDEHPLSCFSSYSFVYTVSASMALPIIIIIIIFNFYIALNTNVSKRFTNILLPRSLDSVLTRTQCVHNLHSLGSIPARRYMTWIQGAHGVKTPS